MERKYRFEQIKVSDSSPTDTDVQVQLLGGPRTNQSVAAEAERVRERRTPAIAKEGTCSPGDRLPHLDAIQKAFGSHDVAQIQAHVGGRAADACQEMGATAFAVGSDVGFAQTPDLHTAAHEAAHVVQQRGGVNLKAQVGLPTDSYEQHADKVADRVVGGESAEELLDEVAVRSGTASSVAVQLKHRKYKNPQRGTLGVVRPTLQGDSLAVQITCNTAVDPLRVGVLDVKIVGRPHHLMFTPREAGQRTEGDHTTAWSVMRLAVLNRLRGKTLAAAVAEMHSLFAEARALPGAQEDRINSMKPARTAFSNHAKDMATAAAKDADNYMRLSGHRTQGAFSAQTIQSALQKYVAAYLRYRNSIGLNVLGKGRAISGGEANPLRLLQWCEKRGPEAIRKSSTGILRAIGVLFSGKVCNVVSEQGYNRSNFPGSKDREGRTTLWPSLVTQHGGSIRSAFPRIWAVLQLTPESISSTMGNSWSGQSPKRQRTGDAHATHLELDPAGKIMRVSLVGRPPHAPCGGGEGDHTTADHLSKTTVRCAMLGKSLVGGHRALNQVEIGFRSLPGAQTGRLQRMNVERSKIHRAAEAELREAHRAASQGPSVSAIQRYAAALLFFRNSIALVVVASGKGVSTGGNESGHLRTLLDVEAQLRTRIGRQQGMRGGMARRNLLAIAGLFDAGTLQALYNSRTKAEFESSGMHDSRRQDDTPGALKNEPYIQTFAAVLNQHLQSIRLLAPSAFHTLTMPDMAKLVERLNPDDFLIRVVSFSHGSVVLGAVPTQTPSTSARRSKRLRKKSPRQRHCCIKGCMAPVGNRVRSSLRTPHKYKPDYEERGLDKICGRHYYADLYLAKKQRQAKSRATNGE